MLLINVRTLFVRISALRERRRNHSNSRPERLLRIFRGQDVLFVLSLVVPYSSERIPFSDVPLAEESLNIESRRERSAHLVDNTDTLDNSALHTSKRFRREEMGDQGSAENAPGESARGHTRGKRGGRNVAA